MDIFEDEFVKNELARFRYELASYRMVFCLENDDFGRNSQWSLFLTGGSQKEFFDKFCEAGKIAEARVLLSRYLEITEKLHEKDAAKRLLQTFKSTIIGVLSYFLKF